MGAARRRKVTEQIQEHMQTASQPDAFQAVGGDPRPWNKFIRVLLAGR